MPITKLSDLLKQSKDRYYYDTELEVPYKLIDRVDFPNLSNTWTASHPDGYVVTLDLNNGYYWKKIKENEYTLLLQQYQNHEGFMNQSFEEAKLKEEKEN